MKPLNEAVVNEKVDKSKIDDFPYTFPSLNSLVHFDCGPQQITLVDQAEFITIQK